MDKIRVLCIAPYEGLREAVRLVAERYADRLEVDVQVGNLNQSLAIAEDAQLRQYDVIMSRGGTSELLQGSVNLPVINIEVSGYDFMRAIILADNIAGKKAFVGFRSITKRADSISTLLNSHIDIFTTQTVDDVEPLLRRLNAQGYNLVIGDVAACRIASEMGMKDMLLTSGNESIADALDKAIFAVNIARVWHGELQRFTNVLDCDDHGIVVFDKNARVIYANEQYRRLNIGQNELAGFVGNISELREQYMLVNHAGSLLQIAVKSFDSDKEAPYCVFYMSRLNAEGDGLPGVSVSNFKLRGGNIGELFKQYNIYDEQAASVAGALVRTTQPLLIRGDVGVGKTELAEAIHRCSDCWNLPFVEINCRIADPVKVLEEMHFDKSNPMRLNGATICFGALDTMSLEKQRALLALLRSLKGGEWRFIATANDDLADKVAAGTVDQSLFAFFSELCLSVPGFGNTQEGIRETISLCIIDANTQYGRQVTGIDGEGMQIMLSHHWKRNLRELRNSVAQMVQLAKSDIISAAEVRAVLRSRNPVSGNVTAVSDTAVLNGSLEEIERLIIRTVYEQEGRNSTKTAARLGIGRSTLWRKLRGEE